MTKKTLAVVFLLSLSIVNLFAQDKDASKLKNETVPVSVSYGLVVDNSGSYRTLLEGIIETVKNIVNDNKADDETFLVRFVDTDKIYLSQDFTPDKNQIQDAADEMYIEGGKTAILDAVYFSAKHLSTKANAEPNRRRALVLITDGEDRQSKVKLEEVLKFLKVEKIQVFSIGLSDEKVHTKLLDKLAKETNGKTFAPKNRAEIQTVIKELTTIIRAQ
ncbi:MAG: VWA domain-containing protein [Acidobacteriota bacterium]|nr:VWA domain-containing protein [Acidobacteriota bacterium]